MNARIISFALSAIMLLSFSFERAAHTNLDSSFGVNHTGYVATNIGISTQASALALQSDGKIVVFGGVNDNGVNNFLVGRYNANGIADTGFGAGGFLQIDIGADSFGLAGLLQPDGKSVIAGYGVQNNISTFTLSRLTTAGALDNTFGTNGIVSTQIGDGASANGIAIQTNNYLVAAGTAIVSGTPYVALSRYDTNGVLDPNFGTGGIVTTLVGFFSACNGVTLQSNGKIVVCGSAFATSSQEALIIRYNADGTPDTLFGNNGIVMASLPGSSQVDAKSIGIQSDGHIMVAGTAIQTNGTTDAFLLRLNSDGTIDTNFGTNGWVTLNVSVNEEAKALVIQSDDKTVITGFSENYILTARFNIDGSLDSTFGNGGQELLLPGDFNRGNAVALDSSNNVLIAGSADEALLVARYFANNSPLVFFTNPIDGATINTQTVGLLGSASETASTVRLKLDGVTLVTTQTSSTGYWDAGNSPILVTNANHELIVELLSGVSVIASQTIHFASTATNVIAITQPPLGATLTVLSTTFGGQSTSAGATVKIKVDGSYILEQPVTDSIGRWVTTNSVNLTNGAHTINAELYVSNVLVATTSSSLTVAAPDRITITVPVRGIDISPLTVTSIQGASSAANSPVQIYSDGVYLITVMTDSFGNWNGGSSPSYATGDHIISVQLVNSAGNGLAFAANNFGV